MDVRVTSSTELVPGRVLAVRAEIQRFSFYLMNIYAPNQGSGRLDLLQKLSSFVKKSFVKNPRTRQYTWVKLVHVLISAARLHVAYF